MGNVPNAWNTIKRISANRIVRESTYSAGEATAAKSRLRPNEKGAYYD